jgi:hypothetical protein
MGFEREDDATRVYEVLFKRFAKHGLRIHPDKKRLVPFFPPETIGGRRETFNFLGFTHCWSTSRKGHSCVRRQTMSKSCTLSMPGESFILKNRMRETRSYGSVRGRGREVPVYSEQRHRFPERSFVWSGLNTEHTTGGTRFPEWFTRWRRMRKLVILLVLAGLGVAVWWRLHPTDEKQVRRTLTALAERATKVPGETTTVMAVKLQNLDSLFAPQIEVNVRGFAGNGNYSREELASIVARVRPLFRSMRLVFHDITVTFAAPDQATAVMTAMLDLEDAEGRHQTDTREIAVCLRREATAGWGCAIFREHQVLER